MGKLPAKICSCLAAATAALQLMAANDLALPSRLYMLPGRPMTLYTESFIRRNNPYTHTVRYSGDCKFAAKLPQKAEITSAQCGDRLVVDLVENEDFTVLRSDTVHICTGEGKKTSPVTAQILGDSFVQGSFYRTALVDSAFVPGLTLVGLRKLQDADGHYDEGRGGWTLNSYFEITKGDFSSYNGFMQPADDRRYLGATNFWRNCHRVNRGELTDFEARYTCGRFEDVCTRFDATTGLPLKPRKGDLMWDSDRQTYICHDGRRWKTVSDEDESAWRFNYAKYIETWGLAKPDFLFETLGLNDFRDDLHADYTGWNEKIEIVKNAYLEAVPDGIFAIVLPCSSCGSLQNRRGDFTTRQNACMWEFRKNLIDNFDNRQADGYHIVDMAITIDNETGYRTDSEGLQTGNPHPYPSYPAMGEPLAAFIQYHRK